MIKYVNLRVNQYSVFLAPVISGSPEGRGGEDGGCREAANGAGRAGRGGEERETRTGGKGEPAGLGEFPW